MILSKITDVGILAKPLSGHRKFMLFPLRLLTSFEEPFPNLVDRFSILALSGTVKLLPPLFRTWIELEN
jgi:hypothetical protein